MAILKAQIIIYALPIYLPGKLHSKYVLSVGGGFFEVG